MSVMGPPRAKVLGTTWVPADDPVPWVTKRMVKAGAFAEKATGAPTQHAVVALLDILTETVSALHDDAKPYRVILSQQSASAATSLNAKMVEIGSRPFLDKDLTDGQRAAIMAGLALHEVGHIRYSQQYTRSLNAQFGAGNVTNAILVLSNLAADAHDELAVRKVFPGLSDAIRPMLWWVGEKGYRVHDDIDVDMMLRRSVQDRVNLAIAASRYPWQCDWSSPDGQAWLTWWRAWEQRCTQYTRPKDHAALVQEAIDYVRAFTPTPTPPPPPPPPPPPGKPPKGEDEGPGRGRPMDDEKPSGGKNDDPKGEKGEKPEPKPGDDDVSPDDGTGDDDPDQGDDEGNDPTIPEDDPDDGDDDGDDGDDPEDEGDDESDEDGDEPDDEDGDDEDDDGDDESQPSDPRPTDDEPDDDEGGDEEPPPTDITQGSLGQDDPDATFDDREDRDMDDPCSTNRSKDPRKDAVLQSEYEKAQRGSREGMRRRRYVHQSSYYGKGDKAQGRVVTSIPRRGGRWLHE